MSTLHVMSEWMYRRAARRRSCLACCWLPLAGLLRFMGASSASPPPDVYLAPYSMKAGRPWESNRPPLARLSAPRAAWRRLTLLAHPLLT